MSQIQISTLFQVNQLQAKIHKLESELAILEESLKSQADNYKNEENIFANVFKQQKIQEIVLKQQADNLVQLRTKEADYKIKIGHIIDKAISDFLTSKNINQLILKITAANPGKKSTLTVDPDLAKNLDIKDFKPGQKGQLRVDFEFSSCILDPEELYSTLRPRLLTKILN